MLDRHELPMLLRAAYYGMHRVSDAHFASHGITADQFVILACLADEDTITQKDLARRASSDPTPFAPCWSSWKAAVWWRASGIPRIVENAW